MGTIIGLIFAVLIGAFHFDGDANNHINIFAIIMIGVPLVLILIHGLSLAFAWTPLQRAEENLTSRILELFQKDRYFRFFNFWIIFFALASVALLLDLVFFKFLPSNILAAVWVFLFGFSLDALYHFYKRTMMYLDPFAATKMFTKKANESVQEEHEQELCEWIDALTEISIKTIKSNSSSLCIHCIEALQNITRHFLASQKSISHHNQDKETKALGITDKVSFTLFYIFHRLESINQLALEMRMEYICSTLISIMGKIAVYAAKYDLTIASYPLHFLGKFALSAQNNQFPEIAVKASLTFLEVSKTIINEIDLTYVDLKDPFLNIVSHLDQLAKNAFRKDKTTSISWLTKPLKDLKELFADPKVASHQDTPVIIQNIDNILAEFSTLELVMRTIPPIPVVEEEEKAKPS